jgi:hypothetical protein
MDLHGFTGHNHHLYFSEAFSGVDVIGSTMLRLLAIAVLGQIISDKHGNCEGLEMAYFSLVSRIILSRMSSVHVSSIFAVACDTL